MGLTNKTYCGCKGTPPLSARSSLSTTLRNPRTSSFNFPVSPDFRSSYSSSFSSCRSFVLWTSAAVTVEELVPEADVVGLVPGALFAPVRWGSKYDIRAGGSDNESVVDGPGWVDRY